MLSYDQDRWLIGAKRSDVWFDAHPRLTFWGKSASFVGAIFIPAVCALIFKDVLKRDFSDPGRLKFIAAMAGVFIVGNLVSAAFRHLELRSAKYYRCAQYDNIRYGEYDGSRRRKVSNSFELQAVLAPTLRDDRKALWNVRHHIDALVDERREHFLDAGLRLENRTSELMRREAIIDRARTILTAASVSPEDIDLHISQLRQQVRHREERWIKEATETAKCVIERSKIDIVRSQELLATYDSLSIMIQREG